MSCHGTKQNGRPEIGKHWLSSWHCSKWQTSTKRANTAEQTQCNTFKSNIRVQNSMCNGYDSQTNRPDAFPYDTPSTC